MESIIYIVMFLALLSIGAKLSLSKWWAGLVYGIIYMIFAILMKDFVINSNKNEIATYLTSVKAHQIVAIIVTIEFAITLAFAFRNNAEKTDNERDTFIHKLRKKAESPITFIEKYYITLLTFPTIYFIETQIVYQFTGENFIKEIIIVGIAMLLWSLGGRLLLKFLLPLRSMREEFSLLISLIMCILAIYSTNSEVMIYKQSPISENTYLSYILGISIFIIVFIIGFIIRKNKKYSTN